MSDAERSPEQGSSPTAPNVEPIDAAQAAREGFDDEAPDDATRVVPRRQRSGAVSPLVDEADGDDTTRIAKRRSHPQRVSEDVDDSTRIATRRSQPQPVDEDLDDSTRIASRRRGGDEVDVDDSTRLSSRSRDRRPEQGSDEEATRFSTSRDRSTSASRGVQARSSSFELPPDFEAAEVTLGTFGTSEDAYTPRSATSAQSVPPLTDPPQAQRAGSAQSRGVLSPGEAARRRDAERRRRLLFTMSAAAAIAAVATLAVLAIVFMIGGGES